jgi:tetratricopeptide (TPR) repeat protein
MKLLKLNRLTDDEIGELSVSMLGDAGKQPVLLELLKRETEGNIFFMVEVVRALAEEAGRLSEIGKAALPETVYASGVEAVVRRRLKHLPEQVRDCLKRAAVIGRELDLNLLRIDASFSEDLLLPGANAAVLEVSEGRWRFAHDKLRSTILRDLTPDEQIRLHRQAAEAIEQVYPADEAYAETLTEHWFIAGDTDKTLHYTLIAADRLILYTADYADALRLLERGLTMINRLPEVQQPVIHARCLRLMGDTCQSLGDYPRAVTCYQESLKVTQTDSLTTMRCLNGLSRVEWRQGNFPSADQYGNEALSLAAKLNNQHEIATSMNNLGNVAYDLGDHAAARTRFEQALAIYQQINDPLGTAWSLNNLGMVAYDQGDYSTARERHEQSLAIRQSIGDQSGIADSLNNLGMIAYEQRDYLTSRAFYEQSLAIEQQTGDPNGVAGSLSNLGLIVRELGDYDAASDYQRQSLAIRREIGDRAGIIISLDNLGEVALMLADPDAAQPHLTEALQLAREINTSPLMLELVVQFAHVRLLKGDPETAALWAGLAMGHPSTYAPTLNTTLKPIRAKLDTTVSPERLTELLEQGKGLDLDTVVQQILSDTK